MSLLQGAQYNPQEYLTSDVPAQVIELAFENGINAIDTSPVSVVSLALEAAN
jgi:aryl-alcohol dehydrogenase-like predicted oxidoreductase